MSSPTHQTRRGPMLMGSFEPTRGSMHTFIVTPDGEHWSVNSRLAGVVYRFREQEAALDFARRLADRARPAHIQVHDAEGKVVAEEVY